MNALLAKLKSITHIQWIALALISIGLAIMIPRGVGMLDFYREMEFAQQNNFRAGNISPDLVRPWMTIRYISVSFAVPQEYLFETLRLQPKQENSMISLARLNNQLRFGKNEQDTPILMERVRQAILSYRANPVATGLIEREVHDWMSVQYIANSLGIPAEAIFAELNLPINGNAYLPLGYLSDITNYPGGIKALTRAIQSIVDRQNPDPSPHP